jgi:membrane protease subunit HflC
MSPSLKSPTARLLLLAIALVLGWRSFAVIEESQLAVVTLFGRPTRTIVEAGPTLKWPVENVLRFEKRLMLYDPPPSEFLTRDKKNLVVDSAICWRISDPLRFVQAAGTMTSAEMRLHDLVWATLAAEMGSVELAQLVGTDPEQLSTDAIIDAVRTKAGDTAEQRLGVEVVDVQVKRLTFPEQNRQAVFARMRAERERIAREYRAQGEEQAIEIRAEADRQRELILAEAYREAEIVRGEGDAQATRIYAAAHNANPELYRFVRTLEAYRTILDDQTTVIMSSDSRLFELLSDGRPGRGR